MRHSHSIRPASWSLARQQGLVLVTAMIMLFVLTMLMVSTMRANVVEERMASNSKDWNIAFQAAEAALRDAERDIEQVTRISGLTGFSTGCSNTGLCLISTTGTPIWVQLTTNNDAGWVSGSDSNTKTVKYGTYTNAGTFASDVVAAQPRYIIEGLALKNQEVVIGRAPTFKYLYRVTAVGFGGNISTRVMLQGVYRQY